MITSAPEDRVEFVRNHIRSQVQEITGMHGDTSGIEIASLIRILANTYEAAGPLQKGSMGLSGPRWGLLLRLLAEERHGAAHEITPTYLSRCQNVSKNTISALLRGLEEQGLVSRQLDPIDHRIFRIRLTEAGRELVSNKAPKLLNYSNDLASGLTAEERAQLVDLLSKLFHSVVKKAHLSNEDLDTAHQKSLEEASS